MLLCILQTHPLLQVVLCASEPISIPGVDCVTYELEDLGVDNVAQILTSIAPQVLLCTQDSAVSCYVISLYIVQNSHSCVSSRGCWLRTGC